MKKVFLLGILFLLSIGLVESSFSQEINKSETILTGDSQIDNSELTVSDNVIINNENKEPSIAVTSVSSDDTETENITEEVSILTEPEEEVGEMDESDAILLDFENSKQEQKIIIQETNSSEDIKKDFLSKTSKEYIKTTDNIDYKLNTNLNIKDAASNKVTDEKQVQTEIQSYYDSKKNYEEQKTFTLTKDVTKKSVDIKFGIGKTRLIP